MTGAFFKSKGQYVNKPAEEKTKKGPLKWIAAIDKSPLFFIGLLLWAILIVFYIRFGENAVFDVHDQLDETICSYVLPARHLFSKTTAYPEMMCDLSRDSLRASAPLFIPLYRYFSVEWAFLIQFFIESLTAFLGMYFLCKKITKSSVAALISGVIFSLLPFQPVYGLNIIGIPLLFLCFYTLYTIPETKKKALPLAGSYLGILYFTLTTHIALSGYVTLLLVLISVIAILISDKGIREKRLPYYIGATILAIFYAVFNGSMILSLVFKTAGEASHRTEFVSYYGGGNFFTDFGRIFLYGERNYAPSYHWFILPVLVLLFLYGAIRYRKMEKNLKAAFLIASVLFGLIVLTCLAYVLLNSKAFLELRNASEGFLRYTDLDRVYYYLPSLWWILAGVLFGIFLKDGGKIPAVVKLVLALISLLPTLYLLKPNLNLYDNINYQNHGSAFTGKQSMKEYYHRDVLEEIDRYIGKDKSSYRIAHIGLSPAPSLVYGFYTVDGYSNNYPLSYKKAFRKVIAKVLEEDDAIRSYYDTWGSRVYLFTNAENIHDGIYTDLPYDFEALRDMNCAYILSDAEIENTEDLILEKSFQSKDSGEVIRLYRLVGKDISGE